MNGSSLLRRSSLFVALTACQAMAQSSSLGVRERQHREEQPPVKSPREAPPGPRNGTYERHSWITVAPPEPRKYRPGDLLTVIVRERRQWKAKADLDTKKEFDLTSELQEFFKFTEGGIGATTFKRGQPNIDYNWKQELDGEGDTKRDDSLTTRLTAKIIDVKPNGLLVLEGRATITHDEEVSHITFTGTCRKEDVTADNTVLSTQVADKELVISNEGALRAASSRGWIPKFLDWLKPF